MKFKFKKFPANPTPAFPDRHSILFPIIPIRLINPSKKEKYIDLWALIDSGADTSIFPAEIAKKIELPIDKEKAQPTSGIIGNQFETYLQNIIFEVGGWQFKSYACFTFTDIYLPILGREGFFNLFEIKIDYSKENIELKPKLKPLNA